MVKKINIYVSDTLHSKFKKHCIDTKTDMTKRLTYLMQNDVFVKRRRYK